MLALRRRLKSVNSLGRIAKALQTINSYYMAAAKRDFERVLAYESAVRETVAEIVGLLPRELVQGSRFVRPLSTAPRVIVAFFSDGGLCGNYNDVAAEALLSLKPTNKDLIFGVGATASENLAGLGLDAREVIGGLYQAKNTPLLVDFFLGVLEPDFSEAWAVYATATPGTKARAVAEKMAPLTFEGVKEEIELIGDPEAVLDQALGAYLTAEMLKAFYAAAFAEFSMRWMAMVRAEDKSKELVREVSLQISKTRQERLTRELQDVVGGMDYDW